MTVKHAELDAALAQASLGSTVPEWHGSIVGCLCAGRGGPSRAVLAALELEGEGGAAPASLQTLLDAVCGDIASRLRAREPVLPLLPEGKLSVRADAMVDWCRGFLGGLGLAGVAGATRESPEARRILDIVAQIAARHLACDDDDEVAFAEILEFPGAAVARLHAAVAPAVAQ